MQLQLLWNLQELDLAIRSIREDLENAPEKSGVGEKHDLLEQLRAGQAESEACLKGSQKILRELEMKAQKLIDNRKELYENMYAGKIGSVKELEQMQRRLDGFDTDKKKLEDQVILLMETIEEQEARLREAAGELNKSGSDLAETQKKLAADLKLLTGRLSELEERRQQKAGEIERKFLDKYTVLADKHQGRPLARVDNNICGGCRVFISGALRGHLYNPDALVYCENCGRLLVIVDD